MSNQEDALERGGRDRWSRKSNEMLARCLEAVKRDLSMMRDGATGIKVWQGPGVEALAEAARRLRRVPSDPPEGEAGEGLLSEGSLLVSNSQSPHEGHRCAVHVNPVEEDWGPMKMTEPIAVAWADNPGVATVVALRRADKKLRSPSDPTDGEPDDWENIREKWDVRYLTDPELHAWVDAVVSRAVELEWEKTLRELYDLITSYRITANCDEDRALFNKLWRIARRGLDGSEAKSRQSESTETS